ncbi:hypothetical protein ACFE04_021811 [Oxalis oulophora]
MSRQFEERLFQNAVSKECYLSLKSGQQKSEKSSPNPGEQLSGSVNYQHEHVQNQHEPFVRSFLSDPRKGKQKVGDSGDSSVRLQDVNWHESAYQEIQSKRYEYIQILTTLKFHDENKHSKFCSAPSTPDEVEKSMKRVDRVKGMINFLKAPKNVIFESSKEELLERIETVGNLINYIKNKLVDTAAAAAATTLSLTESSKSFNSLGNPEANQDPTRLNVDPTPMQEKEEQPVQHLIRAIKSISAEAGRSAVSEMRAALGHVDVMYAHDPSTGIYRQLPSFTRPCISTSLSVQTNSASESKIKNWTIQPNKALLDEINYIDDQLMEASVTLEDSYEYEVTLAAGEGTILNFSYEPLSQKLPKAMLRVLVPANYPLSTPIILNHGLPSYEYDLSKETTQKFMAHINKFSSLMTVLELARAWESMARAVIIEFAEKQGGGIISKKYGEWEPYRNT